MDFGSGEVRLTPELFREMNKTMNYRTMAVELNYTLEGVRQYAYRHKIKANKYGNEVYDDARILIYGDYKYSAKSKGRAFELTADQFYELIVKPCTYCGRQLTNKVEWSRQRQQRRDRPKKPFFFTGIDRIDSTQGYTINNTTPCCKTCNYAKRELTLEEFKSWIDALVSFNKIKDLSDSVKTL